MPCEFEARVTTWTTFAADDAGPDGPITVTALAVPWDTPADLNGWGDTVTFAPGSLTAAVAGRVPFLLDHADHPFGYGVAFTDTPDGLVATMAVPRDELADAATAAAVRQMRNGVRTAVSVGAVIDHADEATDDATGSTAYRITAARLLELSSVVVPRFDAARVASIAATHPRGTPAMPDTMTPPVRLTAGGEPPDPDTPPDDDDDTGGDSLTARHPARLVPAHRRVGGRDASLLSIAAAIAEAGRRGNAAGVNQTLRELTAAWTDVTTAQAAGMIQPQWVSEVVGLVEFGRPLCAAFREATITSSPVHFPHWSDLPDVGAQTTQKTEIPSGPAAIDTLDFPVQTYAGGNDVARQVIDWSTPDFILEYFRAATEVWSRQCEAFFLNTLLSVAGNTIAMGGATPPSFIDVIGAAIGLSATAGVGGTIIFACSGDVYGGLWSTLAVLQGSLFGAVNGGFPTPRVVVVPNAPAGTLLIGPSNAAVSMTSPGAPVRLQALDVPRGGVDLAVWGYFAGGALYPDALTKVTGYVPPVVPTAAQAAATTTKKA